MSGSSIAFEVHGRPQPWQRPGGNGKRRFTESASRDAKMAIELIAMSKCREVWAGPVIMDLLFIFEPPKGKRDRFGKFHVHKPDVDNLTKLVKDALNGTAYADDSQVALLTARKIWGAEAKTVITLRKGE